MKFFANCRTLDDARAEYRKLLVLHHPDRGGSEDTFKEITTEYERFLQAMINSQGKKDEWDLMDPLDKQRFGEVLQSTMDFNCRVEIIGTWIFAFEAEVYTEELTYMGFWWSKQHKAFVWSWGTDKKMVPARMTTDNLKNRYGSDIMRKKRFI